MEAINKIIKKMLKIKFKVTKWAWQDILAETHPRVERHHIGLSKMEPRSLWTSTSSRSTSAGTSSECCIHVANIPILWLYHQAAIIQNWGLYPTQSHSSYKETCRMNLRPFMGRPLQSHWYLLNWDLPIVWLQLIDPQPRLECRLPKVLLQVRSVNFIPFIL